jgi:O-methyltransferase domain
MFSGVPESADLYLLKSVLHDWADDRATAVLRSCEPPRLFRRPQPLRGWGHDEEEDGGELLA